MSRIGGNTEPEPAGRHWHGHLRLIAWSAVVAVALIVLVGAVAGTSSARASSRHADGSSNGGPGAPVPLLTDTAAPPPNPVALAPGVDIGAGLDESDPFLTVADGRYVLITSGGTKADPVNIPLTTSTDFVHWTTPVDALPVLPPWAEHGFTWAPDLHRFGTTYALYFTALIAGSTPPTECIGSAFSPSPTGPFNASPSPFICQVDQGGSIDPRVFVDSDGTPWMLWKSDQNIGGSNTPTIMWSQELSSDGTQLLGSPSILMSPDRPWQGTIVEAPDMVKVGGAYWVIYSANWYNSPAYAIGAARCAGPAGPCADVGPGPLLASNLQGAGPGEASVFHDPAGIWLLYSPRRSLAPKPDIPPRPVYITRLGFTSDGPYLAAGPLPSAADLLTFPIWSTTP
jgi:Glycosyl hydrolases family 43